MDKDEDKKVKEDAMLTTENAENAKSNDDSDPISGRVDDRTEPEETDDPIIVALQKRLAKLEDWVEAFREDVKAKESTLIQMAASVGKLNRKAKSKDTENLAGAIKAMAGLALSPDGFAAFKQMVPYLFEE